MLKKGDTIQCSSADDMIEVMTGLAKEGIETDFVYKKNDMRGLWLEVIEVKKV